MQPPQPKHRHRRKKGPCALLFLADFFTLGLFHRCSSTRQEEKKTRWRTYHPSWNILLPSLHRNTTWNLTFCRGSKHKATILFLFLKLDQTLNTYKWPVRRETVKFVSETLKFEGNKINCFPIGQTLSDLLYSWKFWSWKYAKPRCNGGRQSTFARNSAPTWCNVIDFTMLPAQRFWRETVSLLDVMWRRSNQWERALLGKNFLLYNKNDYSTPINPRKIC